MITFIVQSMIAVVFRSQNLVQLLSFSSLGCPERCRPYLLATFRASLIAKASSNG